MRQATSPGAAILLCTLLLPVATAQSQLTANTLELGESAVRPKATLADLELLVGHWKGELLGATAEEVWLPAAGGSMLGCFRLYRDNQVLFYETMIAVEEEGSVSIKLKHFHPDLEGWEEKNEMVTFRFVKATEDAVWLEGLTFRQQEDGSLQGFLAMRQKDGSFKEKSFTYRPVSSTDAAALASSLGADERGMRSYVLAVLETGPTRVPSGEKRTQMFRGHMANIRRLADEGKLVFAGPLDGVDGWRGLFIFATPDIATARTWVSTDPVIINGEMIAEYHKLYGSAGLMMVNEIHRKISKE